jgi:hypothetical protein
LLKVIDLPDMDEERFQQMEKRLNEQAEATRAMNEMLNKFIAIMGNQEAARNAAPPPPVSPPHVTTTLQVSQPSRVKPGVPSHFDGDRVQGRTFLTSCELYILLTQSDFIDEQVHIHWALSCFKGGVMLHINLTSEPLTMRQSSLRYAVCRSLFCQ